MKIATYKRDWKFVCTAIFLENAKIKMNLDKLNSLLLTLDNEGRNDSVRLHLA